MREIKSKDDVDALAAAGVRPQLIELVAKRLSDLLAEYEALGADWDPAGEGWIVLLLPGDDIEDLPQVGLHPHHRGLVGIPKDYVGRHEAARAWEVVACPSNSWAWTYLIPDEVDLPALLLAELALLSGDES